MKNQEITWLLKDKYHDVKSDAFFADCKRLESGEPLAYIIGSIPFLNTEIHLDSHPLIPRPETEHWTEQAIEAIKATLPPSSRRDLELEEVRVPASNFDLPTKELGRQDLPGGGLASSLAVLDLCAGSGAIGVAVAKAIPEARVTFVELDPTHLPTIEKNLTANTIMHDGVYADLPSSTREDASHPDEVMLTKASGTKSNTTIYDSEKYQVIISDLFEKLHPSQKYDFILSNPPYIDCNANTVEDSVVAHEPHLALFGGEAGMELITRIISDARDYLTPLGQLWIEHEPAQVEAINLLAAKYHYIVVTHPDQYGVPRVSVLTMAQ
jgi:methylase of polypeptide subunit release factors